MTTDPIAQQPVVQQSIAEPHAPSSWIDALLAAIERLPLPKWLFYTALLAVLAFINNAVQWMDGTLPPGTFDRVRSTDVVYAVYFLALMRYLNDVARRAMQTFRPVTSLSDTQFEQLSQQLQSVPRRPALLAGLVGVGFIVWLLVIQPISVGLYAASSPLTRAFVVAWSLFGGATTFVFLYHIVDQLRLVERIYRTATNIDLLNLKPVYALSGLTARAGIGLMLFIYFSGSINGSDTPTDESSELGVLLIGALLITGIAAFALPLQGIHRRLVVEKSRHLAEANQRYEATVAKLYAGVDDDHFERMDGINKALASLQLQRDLLLKVSTWPWERLTLQAFVTAILVPVVLWIITRLLDKALNF